MSAFENLPDFEGCRAIEKIRGGAVADLYRAIQQPLGRPVLVKALSPSILPSSPFAASLEREATLLANLQHPNIPHVHDFVRRDDRMWLVLEHVDGWMLERVMLESGPLPTLAALAVALEVTRALAHAHAHGIVHRDVRPRNILVGTRGEVKLVNFSVAVDERLPTAPELLDGNASVGTPLYFSPEQILGEAPDPRSDLFSLGVVLFEMLTGERPFDGPDPSTAVQRIRQAVVPPLSRRGRRVPAQIERIVKRCLEKLPSDRFDTADQLALALESALGDAAANPARTIARALADATLIDRAPESIASPMVDRPSASPPRSLLPAVLGLVVFSLLGAIGGAVVWVQEAAHAGPSRAAGAGLALVPKNPGYLRVVAEPWAHVVVNGQRVDTTPFARPIPLEPGTHYVQLEHPEAPAELRTVQLVGGETVLLDVKMRMAAKPPAPAEAPDAAVDESP